MTELEAVVARIPSRGAAMAKHREGGGRIAAVFPIHYSRALFRAFALLPVEVWGPPRTNTTLGDAHLQAYTCSIVRGGLSFYLSGKLDVAEVVLVPHACDSLQGLGSVLLDFVDTKRPVLTLYNPRGPESASLDFMAAELRRLYERLAEITGARPSSEELLSAIREDERADALLGRLLASRRRLNVDERAFYRLVRSREYLPGEEFAALAEAALDVANGSERKGTGVVLSGIVPEPMEILDALSDAGAVAVGDDFAAIGRRVYPAGKSDEPFQRMAERLLGSPPDSTRGSPIADRIVHLQRLAEQSGAKAILFFIVKFCEPELFYLPQMREKLGELGLRSVVIEADVTDSLPQQAVTRVEALLETVQ